MSTHLRFVCIALALSACGEPPMTRTRGGTELVVERAGASGASTRPGDAPRVATRGDRRALLVGIDHYAEGTPAAFGRLEGARNDVESARRVLVERFGFAPNDVRTLVDSEATHEAIVRGIAEHLLAGATSEREVVFWFAGHGSQVPDLSGRETEGKDETLIAYDSRARGEDGAYDVCDDELNLLFAALLARGARATVVLDACHSGSALRGGATGLGASRLAPEGHHALDPAKLARFWPAEIPFVEPDGLDLLRGDYAALYACKSNELAREKLFSGDDGEPAVHGVFSAALVRTLWDVELGATYADVAERTSWAVADVFAAQHSRAEGRVERRLFDARFPPSAPGFVALARNERELVLRAGEVEGLGVGALLELYAPLSDRALGRARVTRAGFLDGRAELVEGKLERGAYLRARLVDPPAAFERLAVSTDDAVWRARLEACRWVRLAHAHDAECYTLHAREGSAEFELVDEDGLVCWRGGENDDWDAALRREVTMRSLLRLVHTARGASVALRFEAPQPVDSALTGYVSAFESPVSPADDAAPLARGAARGASERRGVVLVVRSLVDHPIFVAAVSLPEDRNGDLVWPGERGREAMELSPKLRELRIPIEVLAPTNWTRPGPMCDRYVVLVSDVEFDPNGLSRRRGGTTRSANDPAVTALFEWLAPPPVLRSGGAQATPSGLTFARADLLVD